VVELTMMTVNPSRRYRPKLPTNGHPKTSVTLEKYQGKQHLRVELQTFFLACPVQTRWCSRSAAICVALTI
jgi:hypothetical protein